MQRPEGEQIWDSSRNLTKPVEAWAQPRLALARGQERVAERRPGRNVDTSDQGAAGRPGASGELGSGAGLLLMDAVVMTDYCQFDLLWGGDGFTGDFDLHFAGQVNGLAGAASGTGLYLPLGRRSGGSQVYVVLHERPPVVNVDEWEDIVEVSVVIPGGVPVGWSSWGTESSGLLAIPAGPYRVRVSARGRDAGHENELAVEIVDCYLVEFWPAEPVPDAILRTVSRNALGCHRDVSSHR